MSITIELPPTAEAALRAEAAAQGRPVEQVAAEALAELFGSLDGNGDAEDPEAVAEIGAALAELEAAERAGTPLMTLEDLEADLSIRAAARRAAA